MAKYLRKSEYNSLTLLLLYGIIILRYYNKLIKIKTDQLRQKLQKFFNKSLEL